MQLRVLSGTALAAALALLGCQKAVLNAPPTSTITLAADPSTVPIQGGSSTIRAIVRLATGELVPDGVVVNFFTTLGTIDARAETVNGIATVTLTSSGTGGVATVSALSGAAKLVTIDVTIGSGAEQATLSFTPSVLPLGGGSATVIVTVTQAGGAPAVGRVVTLAASAPGTLASRGSALVTDSAGQVRDTVTSTAATTVTATVVGSTLTASGTIVLASSSVGAIAVTAQPPSLPSAGGSSRVTAFVTDVTSAPVAGVTVDFVASPGTLSVASAVTDSTGRASTTVTTTSSTRVNATVGTTTAGVTIGVGSGTSPFQIVLSATRTSINDHTLPGAAACGTSLNAQLPVTVTASVTDPSGNPSSGVAVTLTIETSATDVTLGHGGFCTGPTPVACIRPVPLPCGSGPFRVDCATPTPVPAPTPTPTPTPEPACCNTGALLGQTTAVTDSAGRATFVFTFEDTDICACVYGRRQCRTRILSQAANASSVNVLEIALQP